MESKIDFSDFDALLIFLINSHVVPLMKEKIIVYLVCIKAIVIDPPQKLVEDGILQVAEDAVRKVGSIFSSFDLNKMNEYMALELCLQLRDFLELEEIRFWMVLQGEKPSPYYQKTGAFVFIDHLYVERPKLSPYYPKTSPFVFIDHLLENLEELLIETASLIHPMSYLIMMVQRELQFWYSDLLEISSNPPLFLKEVIQTITELAYDTEHVIDLYLAGDVPSSCQCVFWLFHILKEFVQIEQEIMTGEDKEVAFMANKTAIYDILLGGGEQLNLITIDDPHSGSKSKAFTKELYNSPSIIDHFDSRLFCSLAYKYVDKKKSLLLKLLGHLVDLSDVIRSKNEEELTKLVYEYLEGKRFLLVIDKVFDIEGWYSIRRCFPDSQNGSRIVLGTGLRELTFSANPKSIVQPQSPLTDEFEESLIQKVNFKRNMLEVATKIAKRCKPESMSRVHLLLQTIPETMNQWEQVANTLGSRVFGLVDSQVGRILNLTCIYLPDHLRSCFFYLGVYMFCHEFPVPISELIRVWIAEGFVKHTGSQSLEITAQDYITDLMAKNLLLTEKSIGINGDNICHPDRSVYKFLDWKVREDNFVQEIKYSENPNSPYFSSSTSSSPTIYYQRRLIISSIWEEFEMLKPYGPFVHSLFYSGPISNSLDISIIYNNFKFLRILKFMGLIGESITEIGVLVFLTYLSVTSSVDFIPPSVVNLQNLETLIFHYVKELNLKSLTQTGSKVVKVPDFVWDMKKLRHFHVKAYSSYSSSFHSSSFDLEPHRLENSSSILDNLQTFSKPTLAYGNDMEKLLRKLLGLLELECVFLDSWDDSKNCNRFPVLGYLNQLISLTVIYEGEGEYPCEFNFPPNLKKLSLCKFEMPWNEIPQLTTLNNLEVLELVEDAFKGGIWLMGDNVVFPKLKFLGLQNMYLKYWCATHDQFPHLEHLVLDKCRKLEEIPQDFAYISTLRLIKLDDCTPSAENSVSLIQENHMKHWGHDELKISCYAYDFNKKSESESE